MKPRIGMVTIGQAPRVDIVPDMADILGPGIEIVERESRTPGHVWPRLAKLTVCARLKYSIVKGWERRRV